MLVIDASAFVELLTGSPDGEELRGPADQDPHWVVPEHFAIEVVSALRDVWLRSVIAKPSSERGVQRLGQTPLEVWPVLPLLPRIVELAPKASAYDAG